VTVERSGKQVRQRVVTGLAGNTSTIILSGLKQEKTVVLPAASTTSSSGASYLQTRSRLGVVGLGGGGFGGVAAAAAAPSSDAAIMRTARAPLLARACR